MTPLDAMVLAFEASGGDEPLGFEDRLLAALHSLGWDLVAERDATSEAADDLPDRIVVAASGYWRDYTDSDLGEGVAIYERVAQQ